MSTPARDHGLPPAVIRMKARRDLEHDRAFVVRVMAGLEQDRERLRSMMDQHERDYRGRELQ